MSNTSKPLLIIEDDREKKPWSNFWSPDEAIVVRKRLITGDYSLENMDVFGVCIERKSLSDLVQSCIKEWLLFRKKLYRMAAYDMAIVAVEASVGQVLRHEYESESNPNSVMGRVHSMELDHGVSVQWWDNAEIAAREALHWLRLAQLKMSRG